MRAWESKLTTRILSVMRYCYLPLPEKVNEEEWYGGHEKNDLGGMQDYLVSLVYDIRKKTYKDAYVKGAFLGWESLSPEVKEGLVFNLEDAMLGSERAWAIYDKDDESEKS